MTWKQKLVMVTELTFFDRFGHKIRFSSSSSRKYNEQQKKIDESYVCCTGADLLQPHNFSYYTRLHDF